MAQVVKVAALQTATLPFEKAKLDYYLAIARAKKAQIFALPEYATNLFFKELEQTPISLVEEQSRKQIENLQKLSVVYNIAIAAPLVAVKKEKPVKYICLFVQGRMRCVTQQVLMPYDHWNEAAFFANEKPKKAALSVFLAGGLRIAMVSGFDLHFDAISMEILKKRPDIVIVPTASTFGSEARWRQLCQMRAFLNGVYLLRVNRVGEYESPHGKWHFYGDSFLVSPDGAIESCLGDREELLLVDIDKHILKESRAAWGFEKLLP